MPSSRKMPRWVRNDFVPGFAGDHCAGTSHYLRWFTKRHSDIHTGRRHGRVHRQTNGSNELTWSDGRTPTPRGKIK